MNNIKKIYLVIIIAAFFIPYNNAQQQFDTPWPTLADSPWPMVKHDPQFTGRSPYIGPQSPTIVWTKDMEYGIFSGPVIGQEGNLYFGSYYVFADYFYSYSPDGKYIWDYKLGSNKPPQSGIVIDSSNTIYFGSRDSSLYALNPDGTLKWKYNTSGSILSNVIPNIDLQGNIYITNFISILTDEGELYSIKPDGTLNWKVMYESGFAGKSPVFSPDGNTIYIAGLDSNLFALNLDGSVKWKFISGVVLNAPMVDSDGNIYLLPTEAPQYLYSLKPDGTIRWKFLIQNIGLADIFTIPTIDYDGNIYIIGFNTTCCPYYLSLISIKYDGTLGWKYIFDDVENEDFTQPLIIDSEGTVYVGSTVGNAYYAISSEGELKWKLPLNGIFQQVDNTGTIAEDGTLYLGVHDVSLRTGQVKTLIAIRDTGTVSVNENNVEIKDYSLYQNYPNPFNPATIIKYQLSSGGIVTLKVYDILGREVTTLVDEFKSAGSYEINFSTIGGSASGGNSSNLSSGVYIYRITVTNNGRILFADLKKMILLR